MPLSAAFTVDGDANPAEHTTNYTDTVTLEIASRAYNTIAWSIAGTSKSTFSNPTITQGGSPVGSTATFAMPSDPGDGEGRSVRVKCVVTDAQGNRAIQYAIVGVLNSAGRLPAPCGEGATDRHATHGTTDYLNSIAAGAPALGRVQLHDTTHSPVGLWQFQEALMDSSGSGFNLTQSVGNTRYVELAPGIKGVNVTTSDVLAFTTTGTTLQRTGDITIETILLLYAYATAVFAEYTTAGSETEANNTLYQSAMTANQLQWFSEHGGGVDDLYNNARLPPLGQLCHLAWTRTSDVAQCYINGTAFGAASSALTTPTGGTTASFRIVGGQFALASLKIVPSALSAAQVKAEYNRCLGGLLGIVA